MAKQTKAQRPVDVKDMPWSYMGKDALDAAAEHLWNNVLRGPGMAPYHTLTWAMDGTDQEILQQSVLDVFGFAVPAMLRQRAKELKKDGDGDNVVWYLNDLADELETDHG